MTADKWLLDTIEDAIAQAIPVGDDRFVEGEIPASLAEAMRYSVLGGGKRLRASLLIESYRLFQPDIKPALPFAAALEMIHAYSLIHDDLPAMDNDDMRRGKPSNHIAFGEDMAILSGDALLSQAVEVMAQSAHPHALAALRLIMDAAGAKGMIAGQVADMRLSGAAPTREGIRYIQRHKTAALFMAAAESGVLLSGGDAAACIAARRYGEHLGIAFQMADDILDVIRDSAAMGKTTGKDAVQGKQSLVALLGLDEARKLLHKELDEALQALSGLPDTGYHRALAQSVLDSVK